MMVSATFMADPAVQYECKLCGSIQYHQMLGAQKHGTALRWENKCWRCGEPYAFELRYEFHDKSDG